DAGSHRHGPSGTTGRQDAPFHARGGSHHRQTGPERYRSGKLPVRDPRCQGNGRRGNSLRCLSFIRNSANKPRGAMSAQENPPDVLLELAAEGMTSAVDGCASARTGEKPINRFGELIVQRWCDWLNAQPAGAREAALAELAGLSPEEARRRAAEIVARLAPDAGPEDRPLAAAYLAALPLALDRALPATAPNGLPPTVTFDQPHDLLPLLPSDLPPYPAPCELPGTPYRLVKLLGSGGFGAVYRATAASLQHLPFAIKFCLDPAMTAALNQERSLLERLLKAGSELGSGRVVRLYGYDLEHQTPFLVYEYVKGGDLLHYLARRRLELGRPLNSKEVLGLVTQMVEGLAFAHSQGLVHRDLKPANVLVDGDVLKLADFGLGGVVAARALRASRIGATAVSLLSMAERASLFRGAGTPLYVAPEQRRGDAPDPRPDLYSLGVVWFQLLSGDVTRELHPGWTKELLAKHSAPPGHVALIERCVGWIEERPKAAGELLPLIRALPSEGTPVALPASFHGRPTEPIPAAVPLGPPPGAVSTHSQHAASTPSGEGEELRRVVLESLVQQLAQAQKKTARMERFGIVRAFLPGL